MESHLLKRLKKAKNKIVSSLSAVKKCSSNSLRAFVPGEVIYSLGIKKCDDFLMAYREGTTDEYVLEHAFSNDLFLEVIPEYDIKPDHTVIDVGAHIGTFSVLMSSKLKKGAVYAIEASREACNYLVINKNLNECGNLSISHLALSDKNREVELYHSVGSWGHSITQRGPVFSRSEMVQGLTLSRFIIDNDIVRCDLLRMNCEGAEFDVLGAVPSEILRRTNFILVSFHCDLVKEGSGALRKLESHLKSSGYKVRVQWKKKEKGGVVKTSMHRGYLVAIKEPNCTVS